MIRYKVKAAVGFLDRYFEHIAESEEEIRRIFDEIETDVAIELIFEEIENAEEAQP